MNLQNPAADGPYQAVLVAVHVVESLFQASEEPVLAHQVFCRAGLPQTARFAYILNAPQHPDLLVFVFRDVCWPVISHGGNLPLIDVRYEAAYTIPDQGES